MMDFMSTSEGLDLSRAFIRIRNPKVRRKVVELVRALGGGSPRLRPAAPRHRRGNFDPHGKYLTRVKRWGTVAARSAMRIAAPPSAINSPRVRPCRVATTFSPANRFRRAIRTSSATASPTPSSMRISAPCRRRASPARRSPRPTASSSPARCAAQRASMPKWSRSWPATPSARSATSRKASIGRTPRSRCCCTSSQPTSRRASTAATTRTRAPATRASCSAMPAGRRRS